MSDWYCPLPFRHAYVTSHGVGPCCKIMLGGSDLETWSTNSRLLNIQRLTLQGQVPVKCQGCSDDEKLRGRSLRTDSVLEYENQRFTDTHIDFIDYRSSNICNYKCRTCSPMFSHGIANEVRDSSVLQSLHPVIVDKTVSIHEDNTKWLLANLDQIKRFMFTGGEPTVIPAVREIIQEILSRKLRDIKILITTNASFTDDFWYELTLSNPGIHWTVSLDAVGEAAEIIRHGTKWPTVKRNIEWLSQNAPSVNINTVISNLNVLHLKPLLEFVLTQQKLSIAPTGKHGDQGLRHQFAVLRQPDIMMANNLTKDLLARAQRHIAECLDLGLDHEQREAVNSTQTLLAVPAGQHLWEKFKEINSEFDRLRGEDHARLFDQDVHAKD